MARIGRVAGGFRSYRAVSVVLSGGSVSGGLMPGDGGGNFVGWARSLSPWRLQSCSSDEER
jgi:hypothetical protein